MQKIKQILYDLLPVAVGVFLALWVNQMTESRALEQEKGKSLEAIVNEVHRNTKLIIDRFPYHRRLYDSLKESMDRNWNTPVKAADFKPTFQLGFRNGLAIYPPLNETAWESVKIGNAVSLIEYDLRRSLYECYSNIEQLKFQEKTTLDRMNSYNGNCLDASIKPSDIMYFSSSLADLLIQQRRQIIIGYTILEDLKPYHSDEMDDLPSEEEMKQIVALSIFGF